MSTKKRKPSERTVKCYYCSDELKLKNLSRHTEIKHGDPNLFPPREKGIMSIFEFSQKKKKQKVEKKPEPDTSPSKSNVTSTSLLSRLSSAISSLFELLNPFRNAVSSLEKSADKIEKLLQDKDEARVRQLRTYSNHETFGLEHKNEGLIVRASNGQFYGICMVCTKHTPALKSDRGFESEWVTQGRYLDEHKKRTWQRHLTSKMHKEALDLERQQHLSSMFKVGAQKAKVLTQNFLRLVYSSILMFLPYRQLTRLFTSLFLCGFEIGNRNVDDHAAAAACDTYYDYFFGNLSKHICDTNVCTGRKRCFGITADKGTEVNQRQVINIHCFDVDGKLVSVQLAAHIINEIDVSEECAEESTAKALLAHILAWLQKLGLSVEDIHRSWVTVCTDKEACYLLMGKLEREDNPGFVPVADASHGMESLFDDVEKALPWFEQRLSIIDKVHSRYSGSPKKKRKLRRTSDVFDLVYISLKRIVETRYIKYAVVAGDALVKMFKNLILVLEDDISSTNDEGAKGILSALLSETAIPDLLAVLDVLDHAVSFSCSSQSGKFSVFEYLDRRRSFITKITIMSQPSFNVDIKVPGSSLFLSKRLHDNRVDIHKKQFGGFQLGKHNLLPTLRSSRNQTGPTLFRECLKNQQKLCQEILKNMHRLPEDAFCLAIERTIHPHLALQAARVEGNPQADLKVICNRLGLVEIEASILVQYNSYTKILSLHENDPKYVPFWKTKGKWNPIGVIETFMNPSEPFFHGLEDFCVLLERVALLRYTQADTERVVKTIRKVEKRFSGFDEVKEASGKRDRAAQEIFIHENPVALSELPLDKLHKKWVQTHKSSLKKKNAAKASTIENFLKNDSSKARFLTN